jgi:hypothetical protein
LIINYNLVYKGDEPNDIKDLIHDLTIKRYIFRIIPEKIIYMNYGIKYYYIEAECKDSKVIINAYGREAEELFKQVHKRSFFGNKSTS